jgi:YfiH family protein
VEKTAVPFFIAWRRELFYFHSGTKIKKNERDKTMQERVACVNMITCHCLTDSGCAHGFFNRSGGASLGPHDSLNVGLHVGDNHRSVHENRKRIKNRLDCKNLISAKQVHGTRIFCLTEEAHADEEIPEYDALITNRSGVGLMIQHADCQPVLLFDPVHRVVGGVHSGWRGSVQNILGHVISEFASRFSCNPRDIKAAIGPSLGPCCAEFINYRTELPENFLQFMSSQNHFNFWQISRHQLLDAGLLPENIDCVNICTCCNRNYFSYRRAVRENGGITGRLCSVIALS